MVTKTISLALKQRKIESARVKSQKIAAQLKHQESIIHSKEEALNAGGLDEDNFKALQSSIDQDKIVMERLRAEFTSAKEKTVNLQNDLHRTQVLTTENNARARYQKVANYREEMRLATKKHARQEATRKLKNPGFTENSAQYENLKMKVREAQRQHEALMAEALPEEPSAAQAFYASFKASRESLEKARQALTDFKNQSGDPSWTSNEWIERSERRQKDAQSDFTLTKALADQTTGANASQLKQTLRDFKDAKEIRDTLRSKIDKAEHALRPTSAFQRLGIIRRLKAKSEPEKRNLELKIEAYRSDHRMMQEMMGGATKTPEGMKALKQTFKAFDETTNLRNQIRKRIKKSDKNLAKAERNGNAVSTAYYQAKITDLREDHELFQTLLERNPKTLEGLKHTREMMGSSSRFRSSGLLGLARMRENTRKAMHKAAKIEQALPEGPQKARFSRLKNDLTSDANIIHQWTHRIGLKNDPEQLKVLTTQMKDLKEAAKIRDHFNTKLGNSQAKKKEEGDVNNPYYARREADYKPLYELTQSILKETGDKRPEKLVDVKAAFRDLKEIQALRTEMSKEMQKVERLKENPKAQHRSNYTEARLADKEGDYNTTTELLNRIINKEEFRKDPTVLSEKLSSFKDLLKSSEMNACKSFRDAVTTRIDKQDKKSRERLTQAGEKYRDEKIKVLENERARMNQWIQEVSNTMDPNHPSDLKPKMNDLAQALGQLSPGMNMKIGILGNIRRVMGREETAVGMKVKLLGEIKDVEARMEKADPVRSKNLSTYRQSLNSDLQTTNTFIDQSIQKAWDPKNPANTTKKLQGMNKTLASLKKVQSVKNKLFERIDAVRPEKLGGAYGYFELQSQALAISGSVEKVTSKFLNSDNPAEAAPALTEFQRSLKVLDKAQAQSTKQAKTLIKLEQDLKISYAKIRELEKEDPKSFKTKASLYLENSNAKDLELKSAVQSLRVQDGNESNQQISRMITDYTHREPLNVETLKELNTSLKALNKLNQMRSLQIDRIEKNGKKGNKSKHPEDTMYYANKVEDLKRDRELVNKIINDASNPSDAMNLVKGVREAIKERDQIHRDLRKSERTLRANKVTIKKNEATIKANTLKLAKLKDKSPPSTWDKLRKAWYGYRLKSATQENKKLSEQNEALVNNIQVLQQNYEAKRQGLIASQGELDPGRVQQLNQEVAAETQARQIRAEDWQRQLEASQRLMEANHDLALIDYKLESRIEGTAAAKAELHNLEENVPLPNDAQQERLKVLEANIARWTNDHRKLQAVRGEAEQVVAFAQKEYDLSNQIRTAASPEQREALSKELGTLDRSVINSTIQEVQKALFPKAQQRVEPGQEIPGSKPESGEPQPAPEGNIEIQIPEVPAKPPATPEAATIEAETPTPEAGSEIPAAPPLVTPEIQVEKSAPPAPSPGKASQAEDEAAVVFEVENLRMESKENKDIIDEANIVVPKATEPKRVAEAQQKAPRPISPKEDEKLASEGVALKSQITAANQMVRDIAKGPVSSNVQSERFGQTSIDYANQQKTAGNVSPNLKSSIQNTGMLSAFGNELNGASSLSAAQNKPPATSSEDADVKAKNDNKHTPRTP